MPSQTAECGMMMTKHPMQVSTSTHCAKIIIPGTAEYEGALRLQTEMYRQVTRAGSRAFEETVHYSAEHVTHIAIYRQGSHLPLSVVKVIRPPETLIQEFVYFARGSLPARELSSGCIAELGGFVIRPGVERVEI